MAKVTVKINGTSYDGDVVYDEGDILALDNKRNNISQVDNSDYVLVRKGASSGDTPAIVPVSYFAQNIAVSANEEAAKLVETWTADEEQRKKNEKARQTAEEERNTAYVTAEAARNTKYAEAEAARDKLYATAESSRNTTFNEAEEDRAEAESERQKAEKLRADAETARTKAEVERQSQEKTRVSSEASRSAAESQRNNAESQRKQDSQKAVDAANQAANTVNALISQLSTQSLIVPSAMQIDYPTEITTANKVKQRIKVTLLPDGASPNVIFIREEGTSLKADFNGFLTIKGSGTTVFHVIPTMATRLGQEISITVRAPRMRLTSSGKIRLTSSGKIRI